MNEAALAGIAAGVAVPLIALIMQSMNSGRSAIATETRLLIDSLRADRDDWRARALDCERGKA